MVTLKKLNALEVEKTTEQKQIYLESDIDHLIQRLTAQLADANAIKALFEEPEVPK